MFRHGLEELGFSIVEEEMLLDEGKYYVILHVSPGTMHYEHEYEYRYGADLIRKQDPVLKEFLERELAQGEELLAHLGRSGTDGARKRAESLINELEETKEAYHALQELIENWKNWLRRVWPATGIILVFWPDGETRKSKGAGCPGRHRPGGGTGGTGTGRSSADPSSADLPGLETGQ